MKQLFQKLTISTLVVSSLLYFFSLFTSPDDALGIMVFVLLLVCPIYFAVLGGICARFAKSRVVWAMPAIHVGLWAAVNVVYLASGVLFYVLAYLVVAYTVMLVGVILQKIAAQRKRNL